MNRALLTLALFGSLTAGCATTRGHTSVVVDASAQTSGWESVATAADLERINALPERWAKARAAVPKRLAGKLAAEGPLVQPDAALDLPALPPGPYRCRLIRFGGRAAFTSFAPDICYVEGDTKSLSFTKQTGTILPGGWLYADTSKRQVFLGTFRNGSEKIAPSYGHDPARDVAGVIERVAPFRWRLALTQAGKGALLDVYELVPVPPTVPGSSAR
ncbi:DUF4893 domain-containing protein [Sphingomonas alpina]|uniref:DUF4893 domain-containing protein n=1 Tax=Sphingomonas alpina TaxID=653931 RepID=A0A7H0LHF8_9SPHN|nr:DUF4893 domain-containing protein [Sphingomonas alpina]QNQ09111.1 DUF4893 domain-containing protein [Sphingomonas alpina]